MKHGLITFSDENFIKDMQLSPEMRLHKVIEDGPFHRRPVAYVHQRVGSNTFIIITVDQFITSANCSIYLCLGYKIIAHDDKYSIIGYCGNSEKCKSCRTWDFDRCFKGLSCNPIM